jgi:hypothetical protein
MGFTEVQFARLAVACGSGTLSIPSWSASTVRPDTLSCISRKLGSILFWPHKNLNGPPTSLWFVWKWKLRTTVTVHTIGVGKPHASSSIITSFCLVLCCVSGCLDQTTWVPSFWTLRIVEIWVWEQSRTWLETIINSFIHSFIQSHNSACRGTVWIGLLKFRHFLKSSL